jgi:hypothetical protein
MGMNINFHEVIFGIKESQKSEDEVEIVQSL